MKDEGFTYLSGGARATWGVTSGKVCYEVKVTGIQEVELPDSEVPKQFIRVGWSVDAANLQLGK
jgi:heterogeneous nuclear ribonucleoprotein U-like protein 1